MKLEELKGLGPKSIKCLHEIGITTPQQLVEFGAMNTFMKLKKEGSVKPSLNFLYALVGAIEDRHWTEIAKHERSRLLIELEGYKELEHMLKEEGIKITL